MQVFASRHALVSYIRRLVHEQPVDQPFGTEEAAFWRRLLSKHTDAASLQLDQVCSFTVTQGQYTKHLLLHRVDGTQQAVSWWSCTQEAASVRLRERMWALRTEIGDQRQEAALIRTLLVAGLPVCALCEQVLYPVEIIHMDHIYPFEKLVADFLQTLEPEAVLETERHKVDGSTRCLLKDRALAERWQEYHRTHATLRPVHKHCNTKRARGPRAYTQQSRKRLKR